MAQSAVSRCLMFRPYSRTGTRSAASDFIYVSTTAQLLAVMLKSHAAFALLLPFVIVALWHHIRYSANVATVHGSVRQRHTIGTPSGNAVRAAAAGDTVPQRHAEATSATRRIFTRRVPGLGVSHSGDESTECTPVNATAAETPVLDYIVPRESAFPTNCDRPSEGIPELCTALRRVAINREVLVAVCDSNVISQLRLFLKATRKAGVSNVLVIALDSALARVLDAEGAAYWLREDGAKGSHKISAQKFKLIGALLSVGASVLVSDIDVVYVRNPFHYLYRDSDVEGTTDGWDAPTAYGWTEAVEDASMGWAAHTYTHRSTAYNSGLWYIQATLGGQRLLKLLAHRMATENTWDQTAYNEEVGLPARGSHSGAMITRRAANFLCFTNSKTLLRRVHREPQLSGQHIIESHINYHAGKPQKMAAVYAYYHEGSASSLERELANEPLTIRNTTQLEAEDWLQINGAFVGGRALSLSRSSSNAGSSFRSSCRAPPPQLGFTYPLHYVHGPAAPEQPHCPDTTSLTAAAIPCAVLNGLAFDRSGTEAGTPLRAFLLAVTADDLEALAVFMEASMRVKLGAPLLIAPLDAASATALAAYGPTTLPREALILDSTEWGGAPADAADTHAVIAVAFDLWRSLLVAGVGAMLLSPRVVLLRDRPLEYLHGDADVEVASEGWDETSAYGYNHVLDDPSMGHTRSCHGLRIAAHDAWLSYAAPTREAVTLVGRVATRLRRDGRDGTLVYGATPSAASSLHLSEELFLPAHNGVRRSGARTRVSNILCFGNSKLFFAAHLHESLPSHVPLAVHVSYHERPAVYMHALLERYADGRTGAMTPYLTERVSKQDKAWCAATRRRASAADADSSKLVAYMISHGPWAWSGMKPLHFKPGGELQTPWGSGSWGRLSGAENALFADFVGNHHNIRFDLADMSRFTSARCGDAEPVIGRLATHT